jgi:hypothetical protein
MSAQLLRNDGIEPSRSADGGGAVVRARLIQCRFGSKCWRVHFDPQRPKYGEIFVTKKTSMTRFPNEDLHEEPRFPDFTGLEISSL